MQTTFFSRPQFIQGWKTSSWPSKDITIVPFKAFTFLEHFFFIGWHLNIQRHVRWNWQWKYKLSYYSIGALSAVANGNRSPILDPLRVENPVRGESRRRARSSLSFSWVLPWRRKLCGVLFPNDHEDFTWPRLQNWMTPELFPSSVRDAAVLAGKLVIGGEMQMLVLP